MNRTLGLAAIAALAVGIGGTAVAGQAGTSKTGTPQQKPGTAQMMKEKAQKTEGAAAQRVKGETDSVRLSSLDKDQVKAVQNKLKDLGFYKQEPDGALNAPTKAALTRYFTMQLTLLRQEKISDSSLSAFGFNQDEIQRVRGVDEQRGPERQPTRGYEQPKPKMPKEQPKQK